MSECQQYSNCRHSTCRSNISYNLILRSNIQECLECDGAHVYVYVYVYMHMCACMYGRERIYVEGSEMGRVY